MLMINSAHWRFNWFSSLAVEESCCAYIADLFSHSRWHFMFGLWNLLRTCYNICFQLLYQLVSYIKFDTCLFYIYVSIPMIYLFWKLSWMSLTNILKIDFFFRTVLGSQWNWMGITEFLHIHWVCISTAPP